jgi:hypothetical protein
MKVAPILPTPLLGKIQDEEYGMCLFQIVKTNPEYAEFYRNQVKMGHFIIMDNGAAEGTNPSSIELMEVYPLVNPSEIVLPDVVYDKHETLKRTEEAYIRFCQAGLDKTIRFMAVPQGRTFEEWRSCAEIMIQQDAIKTLGVSKFVTPKFQEEMGADANVRLECVDAINELKAQYNRPDIEIHLLGCWSNPKEIGEIAKAYGDLVRGTDSAIAYVYARAGARYWPDVDRPDNDEIDFHNGTCTDPLILLPANIKHYKNACQGTFGN